MVARKLTAVLDEDTMNSATFGDSISAELKLITQSVTDTLTEQECRGTQISNYGQTVENTQTLPTASEGLNGIVVIGATGVGHFHLKAGPSDKIYLNGIALDDGDKATLDTPLIGYFFSFASFQTGASTYDWLVIEGQGSLTDGGA